MDVILISSYELGHQPFHVASPAAHLLAEGHTVHCNDLAVERLKEDLVRQADFVGISIPMHTAIRLGVQIAQRLRRLNPSCHICLYGLYASLNKEYLLRTCADSLVGGEYEQPISQVSGYATTLSCRSSGVCVSSILPGICCRRWRPMPNSTPAAN